MNISLRTAISKGDGRERDAMDYMVQTQPDCAHFVRQSMENASEQKCCCYFTTERVCQSWE